MRQEFTRAIMAAAFKRANGACESCTAKLFPGNIQYDHQIPDALGGAPTLDNCKVLCRTCHRSKTSTADQPRIAKMKRQRDKNSGAKRSSSPMPGSKRSGIRKRMDGTVERRERPHT